MPGPMTRMPGGEYKPHDKVLEVLSSGQKVYGRHPVKGYIVCNAILCGQVEKHGYTTEKYKRCMSRFVGRNGRCRKHGMNAGRKPGVGRKIAGEVVDPLVNLGAARYKGVNGELRSGMLESLNLERQLSLKPDIAFVDAVIQELGNNLAEVIDRKTLSLLNYVCSEYRFLKENPPDAIKERVRLRDMMDRVLAIVESADAVTANKMELMRLQGHRMRLAEAEGKQQDRDAENMRKDAVLGMVVMFADGILDRMVQTEEQLEHFQDVLSQVRDAYGDYFRDLPQLAAPATNTASITPKTEEPVKHIDDEVIDAEWERYEDDESKDN